MRCWRLLIGMALLVLAGCAQGEEQEARMTPADTVHLASETYAPEVFDTVQWASNAAALERGENVFKWACADCHGERGDGAGGRVIDGDTLHPPSFLAEDWPYADDPDGLHRKIYVGNTLGMPHWGLRRMLPRDIVAVELYIRESLRNEGD